VLTCHGRGSRASRIRREPGGEILIGDFDKATVERLALPRLP
jgi:hypothetical protein